MHHNNIMYLLGIVILSSFVAGWDVPSFCHKLDCPEFVTVRNNSEYEIRKYNSSKWASTIVKDISFDLASHRGFFRLYDYISGQNSEKKEIPMTVPVKTYVEPGEGANCESTFKISFFVPYSYQKHAPEPTNPDVFLEDEDELLVAVHSFGGFANDKLVVEKAKSLGKKLKKDKVHFDSERYFFSGYDAPTTLFHRHNEVWFKVRSHQ